MSTTLQEPVSFVQEGFALKYMVHLPREKPTQQRAIILLHGVGSNEKDLFRMAGEFPGDYLFITPRGLYQKAEGKYAWYEVDFSTGKPIINTAQEENSRNVLIAFIQQVKQEYGLAEIYLGGFSQGAIMSYSIGLTHPELVSGLIILSGRILAEIKPQVQKSRQLEKLKVFIAHGRQDNMLPVTYAQEAREYLAGTGIAIYYQEYDMGHTINENVLQDINNWLDK